jgi:hypothetical protein
MCEVLLVLARLTHLLVLLLKLALLFELALAQSLLSGLGLALELVLGNSHVVLDLVSMYLRDFQLKGSYVRPHLLGPS